MSSVLREQYADLGQFFNEIVICSGSSLKEIIDIL